MEEHNSDNDEGNKDIHHRRCECNETVNSNDSEEEEVFGIFGIGSKSDGTEMSWLQKKKSKLEDMITEEKGKEMKKVERVNMLM